MLLKYCSITGEIKQFNSSARLERTESGIIS